MVHSYAAPAVLSTPTPADAENEWVVAFAIAAAVAAILALPLAVVIFICSVCQATSFWACYWDVINWWGSGC
jgi:H+/Cl- antiporter ClcA